MKKAWYIIICITVCLITFFTVYIKAGENSEGISFDSSIGELVTTYTKICDENDYSESVPMKFEDIDSIAFVFSKPHISDDNNKYVMIEFIGEQTEKTVFSRRIALSDIPDKAWCSVKVSDAVKFTVDTSYNLIVSSNVNEYEALGLGMQLGDAENLSVIIETLPLKTLISPVYPALTLAFFVIILLAMNYYNKFDKKFEIFDSIKYYDIAFWLIVFVFSSLFFGLEYDLKITAMHAYDLIDFTFDGDFLNYYSCVLEKAEGGGYLGNGMTDGANYNILNYIILAIPLVPVYFLNILFDFKDVYFICLIIDKILIMLLIFYSSLVIEKLCEKLGFDKSESKLVSYVYLCSPMLIFATSELGQIDVFYIIITLISLKMYLEKKYIKFSLTISLAIALKTFPLLIFIPLILYIEKNIPKIIAYLTCAMSISVVTRLLYIGDKGYAETKEYMNGYYGFLDKILGVGLTVGNGQISYFLIIFITVCLASYCMTPHDNKSLENAAVLIPLMIFGGFTIFTKWHPQWVSILVPFMVISLFKYIKQQVAFYIELIINIAFILSTNLVFGSNVDIYMVNGGVLPKIFGRTYEGFSTDEIIYSVGVNAMQVSVISYTVLAVLITAFILMILINIKKKNTDQNCNFVIRREFIVMRTSVLLLLNLVYITIYFTK